MELFLTSPAGISVHHNYIGGLLEHTVNTMSQAVLTADNNRGPIDKDLLLTGSFLHDSGKIREMLWDITKEYTTEGKLLVLGTKFFQRLTEWGTARLYDSYQSRREKG